ncbi:VWA domain-containing protein [Halogeometricum sp. S1BR25-6]|uniref:VWA domain-containing protein n=1 Tax=Halogeometricum salsisoli TaxID=2950536 RepID=A0ABU2GAH4_9EURY|nr:VWA domain-containing protein [Halogeometricum sp. S1BR25-6]MDS0297795.1 VWA domain-containing protein [Halogeometricum sp. S1BR25-6]
MTRPDGGPRADANGRLEDAVADHLRVELVRFVRALRRAGASVPANAATTAGRSLAVVGLGDRDRVRSALRAGLLADRADFETFDRLFAEFWRRLAAGPGDGDSPLDDVDGALAPFADPADEAEESDDATDGDDGGETDGDSARSLAESFAAAVTDESPDGGDEDEEAAARYSPTGAAEAVDGGFPLDSADLDDTFAALTRALADVRGRRFGPGDDDPDVRRALRTSAATGGAVLSIPQRERRRTAVRALFVVDVSRSVLDAVDRGFLVDFLRRARAAWDDSRVFFFDEDVREVTDAVDAHTAAAALDALDAAEARWGGGTRIGDSLARLRETAPEAVDRHTVVFVVSDGLEMGDVAGLERELSWLRRRADRVLWLNPLATAAEYEPTARGMAAALPFVDGLFAFAGERDVREMARQLCRQGAGGRVGYEFDPRRTAAATEGTAATDANGRPTARSTRETRGTRTNDP